MTYTTTQLRSLNQSLPLPFEDDDRWPIPASRRINPDQLSFPIDQPQPSARKVNGCDFGE